MRSSSTTEPARPAAVPPGTVIAGFRVERPLRADARAVTYEAMQLSLRRRVELTLHDDPEDLVRAESGAQRQALIHHPAILPVFETGRCEHGLFVARRLAAGGSLAEAIAAGTLAPPRAERLLADVAAALEAAHAAGVVHGDLRPEAVRLEGDRAFLAELALPADLEAEAEADRHALARLTDAVHAAPAPAARPPRSRRRGRYALAALAGLATVAVAVVAVGGREAPAPAVTPGALALGSALAPGPAATRDCEGRAPQPNSLGCTVIALDASGRPVTAPSDGVLRGWAVRGASGALAVQVVRPGRDGTYREVARSQVSVAPDTGPHGFRAEVPVRRGDLLGAELQPGAAVGIREGGRGRGAMRWTGPLEIIFAPRPPDGAIAAGEVLVRFDVVPGARLREPPQLRGAAARSAPAGEVIDREPVELAGGREVRLAVVRAGGAVVVDLESDRGRVARMAIPGADPRGRLELLEQGFTAADYVRVKWRNPGGGPVLLHGYAVSPDGLRIVH